MPPGRSTPEPLTAAGSPSPLSPSYMWNLTGTGWSEGSTSGASLTVEAVPEAGLAVLTVEASAVVGSNTFSVGPAVVDLEAVPTTFTGGDANRTNLDVGGFVSFTADGTGAPGYTYTADISPGLGLPTTDWSCSTSSSSGDGVTFACRRFGRLPYRGHRRPHRGAHEHLLARRGSASRR